MGNTPTLSGTAHTSDVVVLDPVAGIVAAVAALEEGLAGAYDGVGVIHAPRAAAPHAAAAHLIERDGSVLRTPLGTMWAFGAGYDRAVGPDGEADVTGTHAWMYATGAIARWRSEPIVNPPGYAALNLTTNDVTVFAERIVMLYRDCVTVAVDADLVAPTGAGGF